MDKYNFFNFLKNQNNPLASLHRSGKLSSICEDYLFLIYQAGEDMLARKLQDFQELTINEAQLKIKNEAKCII